MTTLVPARLDAARPAAHGVQPRRKRWWVLGSAAILLLAAGLLVLTVPVPFLEGYLERQVTERVSAQVACPGAAPPQITVEGGRMVPQLLQKKLTRIRVTVPDATLSGVPHSAFTATLLDVRQTGPGQSQVGRSQVGKLDAAITAGFADLPTPAGTGAPTFKPAADGGLAVNVVMPAKAADHVRAKLFLKMRLRGETAESVPQRLEIFGRTVPAAQVTDLTGGVRTEKLPHLPAGVTYRSITPQRDGVHVALSGVSTTPLTTLPTDVGGHTIAYSAAGGLLDLSTSVGVKPIINVPLTIHTKPTLAGTTLTLVPQTVRILGADRKLTDPLARLVLTQIDQKDLTRTLPTLPAGVGYRSVSVDSSGIKVVISGVNVKPFAALQQPPDGRPTTFGAENGLLTAAASGGTGSPTPVTLYAKPAVTANTLAIQPTQIEMFGIRFPAADVLAQVTSPPTSFPLQKLPPGLTYQSVQVLPKGLLIHLSGANVTLTKGVLCGQTS
jgi:hypothetical protein